jgi:hypothetical protein
MLSSAFVVTTHLIFIIEADGIPLRDAASTTACSNHVLSSLSFAFTSSFFFCGVSDETFTSARFLTRLPKAISGCFSSESTSISVRSMTTSISRSSSGACTDCRV